MKQKGFTLIELLVVISIITLLSSIMLVAIVNTRMKARDVKRKADLRQLKTALELYYDSNNSAYPDTGSAYYSSEPGDVLSNNSGNWIPGLATAYVAKLPRDPLGGVSPNPSCSAGSLRAYAYISDAKNYKLFSRCAPETAFSSKDQFYDPVRPDWAWMVCSGEPACSTW